MSILTIPYSFTNGTTADATQVNANFNAVAASVNNINSTNIGALGIYASQIIPTSAAQATFGGTLGYTFLAPATGVVPLTVSGVSGQTADLFDVTLTSGGTVAFKIAASGTGTFSAALNGTQFVAATGVSNGYAFASQISSLFTDTVNTVLRAPSSSGNVDIVNAADTTINATFFDAGGLTLPRGSVTISAGSLTSTAGVAVGGALTGVTTASMASGAVIVTATGQIAATPSGASTGSYVAPTYTAAGAATASTLHNVTDTAVGNGGTVTVTLTGAAVFSGAADYVGIVQDVTVPSGFFAVVPSSGSQFVVGGTTNGHSYRYYLWGF